MDEKEIWKPIPNYEGIYEASNLGRIRTCEGKTTHTDRHGTRHWKQRILKPRGETPKTGYRVSLWKDGKQKDWLVARLVASAFYGESDLTVNHIDGNRLNNRVENLEWCSVAENIRKGFATGLFKKTQKRIKLKKGDEIIEFASYNDANRFLGKSLSFISEKIKRKKFNIGEYEIIEY